MKIGAIRDWTAPRINPTRLPVYFSPRYGAKTGAGAGVITGDAQRMVPHAPGPSPGAPKGSETKNEFNDLRNCLGKTRLIVFQGVSEGPPKLERGKFQFVVGGVKACVTPV